MALSSANGSDGPNGHQLLSPSSGDGETHTKINGSIGNKAKMAGVRSCLLQSPDVSEVQDLICVGFGPASLAIAVALHDALERGSLAAPASPPPKVLFLEKQPYFAWHAGMLLPGAKMQISFLKDLATLRDPRSHFTFVNYLHCQGRLVEFTNLGTFLPARAEYEDYLRWCASHFDDLVLYNRQVVAVEAEKEGGGDGGGGQSPGQERADGAQVTTFRVVAQPTTSGTPQIYRARNVLIATGGRPSLPKSLQVKHPHIIHSSQYAHLVPLVLDDPSAPYRVAVVGAGQSSAEIFNNIQQLYPKSRTYLVMRSEFLKPSDDSPFVNSIFNPSYIDELYPRPAKYRQSLLADARSTNYGVVRLELIEALYDRMYHQHRELGSDATKWPHRILGGRQIQRVEPSSKGGNRLRLFVEACEDGAVSAGAVGSSHVEALEVDVVIAATGYQRDAHVAMLKDLWPLLPLKTGELSGDTISSTGTWTVETATLPTDSHGSHNGVNTARTLHVARDYRVEFEPGRVAPGSGVWLQGCCEATHGLSDTLLSVLSTRSGEIVQSIFGHGKKA